MKNITNNFCDPAFFKFPASFSCIWKRMCCFSCKLVQKNFSWILWGIVNGDDSTKWMNKKSEKLKKEKNIRKCFFHFLFAFSFFPQFAILGYQTCKCIMIKISLKQGKHITFVCIMTFCYINNNFLFIFYKPSQ